MLFLYNFLVICVNLLSVLGKNEYYKGHKVYNVKFLTEKQQNQLHMLKSDAVDFWKKPSVQYGIVGQAMVAPSDHEWFEKKLEELDIEKDVFIQDVYDFLSKKENGLEKTLRNSTEIEFDFGAYYRYNVIINHINRLNETYYNSTTISFELIEYGQTEENRPLMYIKVTSRNESVIQKPVIVVEAGVNPREWVTIPSALYVLDRLLSNKTTLLDDFEWIVIPVLNPDGYEYTHTNLRFWSKNRSTRSHLTFICPGANINRNFDVDWSTSDSSSSPCSHIYAGIEPFSEEETQLILSIFQDYGSRILLYFSVQNTGGFVSYPWQFEKAASGMFRQHLLLSRDMVAAMNGSYNSGVGSVISGERTSGTSTDYARNIGILYNFNVDVIPTGEDGVMVPENEIVNVAEDVWRAVAAAAENVYRY